MSNVQTKKEALLEEVLGDANDLIDKIDRLGKEIPQDIARVKVVIDDVVRRSSEVLEAASRKHEKGMTESLFMMNMASREIEAAVKELKKDLKRIYWYIPFGMSFLVVVMVVFHTVFNI